MAKKCMKIAAHSRGGKKVSAHVRCIETKGNGGDDGDKKPPSGGGGGGSSGNGIEYANTKIKKGEVFGSISDDQAKSYMKLAGVPKNIEGTVYVSMMRNGTIAIEIDDHPDITLKRKINKDKTIENELFVLSRSGKVKYKGRDIFKSQVDEAQKQGYKSITCVAARYNKNRDDVYNGYYTWARLGYKEKNPGQTFDIINKYNKKNKTKHKELSELMSTQSGRDYWKTNGREYAAIFDLTPNSYSMNTLNSYLKEKG